MCAGRASTSLAFTAGRPPPAHPWAADPAPPAAPRRPAFIPLDEIVHPNGEGAFPGCETNLFVPAIESNMDCTLCLNCVRACPYDNVALTLRAPGRELGRAPWARRGGLAVLLLGVLLAFWGVMNAFAMVPPYYALASTLSGALHTTSKGLLIALLYAAVTALGLTLTVAAGMLADAIGGARPHVVRSFRRWGYVVVALGFGFWAAHYLFHFLTGAAAAVPVFEHFFSYRGLPIDPNWRLAQMVPSRWLFPIQAGITAAYSVLALVTALRIGLRDFGRRGVLAMWPMLVFVAGVRGHAAPGARATDADARHPPRHPPTERRSPPRAAASPPTDRRTRRSRPCPPRQAPPVPCRRCSSSAC